MTIVAIDFGIKNFAYAKLKLNTGMIDLKLCELDFGVLNIDKKSKSSNGIIQTRIDNLYDVLRKLTTEEDISQVLIEKQSQRNTKCMDLMYATYAMLKCWNIPVIIFDPKLKFSTFHKEYDTANKRHKKLSIEMALTVVNQYFESSADKWVDYMNKNNKMDDISDCIIMCLSILVMNNDLDLRL